MENYIHKPVSEPHDGQKKASDVTTSNSGTTCSSLSSDGVLCRICHDDVNKLITPCRCKGSIGYVHESCLLSWLIRSGNIKCELCETTYILRVKKSAVNTWTRKLSQHDRAIIFVILACLAFFLSTTIWLLWSLFSPYNIAQRNNNLFVTCYALYGFMDLFCFGVFINEMPHLRLVWKRWKLLTYDIRVLPFHSTGDEKPTTAETPIYQDQNKHYEYVELTRVSVGSL